MFIVVIVVVSSIACEVDRCTLRNNFTIFFIFIRLIVYLVVHISIATSGDVVVVETQYGHCTTLTIFYSTAGHLALVCGDRKLRNKERDVVHHKVVTLVGGSEVVDRYARLFVATSCLNRENDLLPAATLQQLTHEVHTRIVPFLFILVLTLDITTEDRVTFA